MSVLAIVAALVLEQWRPVDHGRTVHAWLSAWATWLEQAFNVVRYRRMPRGGHFAAMEAPDLFIGDVREFFGGLRHGR